MFRPAELPDFAADWRPWWWCVLLSLLLHGLFLFLVRSAEIVQPELPPAAPIAVTVLEPRAPPPAQRAAPEKRPPRPAVVEPPVPAPPAPELPRPEPAEKKVEVPLPEQQIVSPPEAGIERAPEQTRFLSDRDTTVEKETVRRGEPAPGEGEREAAEAEASADRAAERNARPKRPGPPSAAPGEPAAEVPPRVAALPDLERLLPNAAELARQGYGGGGDEAERVAQAKEEKREKMRASGAWPSLSDRRGTFDFLPDVREGDITLLNTKAELFAPFVRRVAVRVFQNLVIALRRDLAGRGPSAEQAVTARVVMDQGGEMVSFGITERSPGFSLGVDRKLRQACEDGFFDRNPPPGAETEDGRIHFLLRAQVGAISDGRGYRVGYQVLFQAGLL